MFEATRAALPPHLRKPRLRRAEVPEYVRIVHGVKLAASTLAKRVTTGGGPPYVKFGVTPLYPVEELDEWVKSKLSEVR